MYSQPIEEEMWRVIKTRGERNEEKKNASPLPWKQR